jgi:hypothetical protein
MLSNAYNNIPSIMAGVTSLPLSNGQSLTGNGIFGVFNEDDNVAFLGGDFLLFFDKMLKLQPQS